MAGTPPFALRVERRGVWQAGVGALGALAIGAMFFWWLSWPARAPGWVAALALAGSAGAAACLASLLPVGAAVGLRWDTRQWWCARSGKDPVAGRLGVAIDLGDWMLLRFVPFGANAWLAARWVPVQRRGLEAVWHTLRCAAHARQPDETAAI